MSVFRINKTKDYTVMSNHHLKDKRISLKAKGLLTEMLSLPENWDYSIKGLVAINKENEVAVKGALDELKNYNYLIITKKLPNETESGRIEYIYDIYETPKQEVEKQDIDFLGLEFLGLENQGQYNINNKVLNNKVNNNIYNIYGEFKNVKLTDDEYKKIKDKNLLPYIEKLSSYIASKGKRYKNHYATILNWSRKDSKEDIGLPKWFNEDLSKEERKEDDLTDEQQQLIDKILGGNR